MNFSQLLVQKKHQQQQTLVLGQLILKEHLKDRSAVSVDLPDFLGANFSFSSLNVKEVSQDIFISCVLVDRQKNVLNDQQSEVLVNHPVKGRPQERVTYTAIKKKKRKETFCIFPKANQRTVSPFLCKKEE